NLSLTQQPSRRGTSTPIRHYFSRSSNEQGALSTGHSHHPMPPLATLAAAGKAQEATAQQKGSRTGFGDDGAAQGENHHPIAAGVLDGDRGQQLLLVGTPQREERFVDADQVVLLVEEAGVALLALVRGAGAGG